MMMSRTKPRKRAASPVTTTTTYTSSWSAAPISSPTKKQKKKPVAAAAAPPKKKAIKETRASRYRTKCPTKIMERIQRARTQRLYLIARDDSHMNVDAGETKVCKKSCRLTVLGSTGNVYTVTLGQVPTCDCPDFQNKQDLCKHILFCTLKVVGLQPDDPLLFQKAYTASELDLLFSKVTSRSVGGSGSGTVAMANASVRYSYAQLTGDTTATAGASSQQQQGPAKRQPLQAETSDCPICFDTMLGNNINDDALVYCRSTCGANFHKDCIVRWMATQQEQARVSTQSCPNCRGPWLEDDITSGEHDQKQSAKAVKSPEGYVNLGRLQGQSPVRDTSTYRTGYHYYSGVGRGRGRGRGWS